MGTTKAFRAGEIVFKERALVVAQSATNLARVRAYCLLPESDKLALRDEFWAVDPGVRCAATAACRADNAGTGDSATDVLALLPCDACNKGFTMPDSAGSSNWTCEACGRTAAGDAMRLAAEAEIAPRILVELKPPKNHKRAEKEELEALLLESRGRLGRRHWLSAASALVLSFRGRPSGGGLDSVAIGNMCRFLGWLIDAQLPLPPASIVRTPVAIAMEAAAWLGPGAIASKDDRRCIAGRILNQFLLPLFDASGATIAHVANTGMRVQALRQWLETMQGTCGREGCGKALAAPGAGYTDSCGKAKGLTCSRCKQVRYCSQECQKADWKDRHKGGCLPASESLAGDAVWKLLTE